MLTGPEIVKQHENKFIVIDPFDPELVQANSYDVRIGSWVVREREPVWSVVDKATPLNEIWQEPEECVGVIRLKPSESILGHTIEAIGAHYPYAARMHAKSTSGRLMLSVCKCAGHGGTGYTSRWTMEITNSSKHTIEIPVGMSIAQIVFDTCEGDAAEYRGSYGQEIWRPDDMLPRVDKLMEQVERAKSLEGNVGSGTL